MTSSKYIRIHNDVLIEWIFNSEQLLFEDYILTTDTRGGYPSICQTDSTNGIESETGNLLNRHVFKTDPVQNKWGLVTSNYSFLQTSTYPGNSGSLYDTIRVHFPVDYNFQDKLGCVFRILSYDYNNTAQLIPMLSNIFDKTDESQGNVPLELSSPPFLFGERLWGKYLEYKIPAIRAVAEDRANSKPRQGSLNYLLTGGVLGKGLSRTAPALIEFYFIEQVSTILGRKTWTTSQPYQITTKVHPEFEDLSLLVTPSTNGDFFEIVAQHPSGIGNFMASLESDGRRAYITYDVTVLEENIRTQEMQYLVQKDFDQEIRFRPTLIFTTTTAAIDVTMKLVFIADNNTIIRRASWGMLQNEIGLYGRKLQKIQLSTSAFRPQVWVAKADQIIVDPTSLIGESAGLEVVKEPYPVMYEKFNVVAKDVGVNINSTQWFGTGELTLTIYPYDNIIKLIIGTQVGAGIGPYAIPDGNIIFSVKSDSRQVDVPLWTDSSEVDLTNGTIIFRITEQNAKDMTAIYNLGWTSFYVTVKTSSTSTVLYTGQFKPQLIKK